MKQRGMLLDSTTMAEARQALPDHASTGTGGAQMGAGRARMSAESGDYGSKAAIGSDAMELFAMPVGGCDRILASATPPCHHAAAARQAHK